LLHEQKTLEKSISGRTIPEKLNRTSRVRATSGNKLESNLIYPNLVEINMRKFTYNFHAFINLNEDIIL
jgi:hypothetical protein